VLLPLLLAVAPQIQIPGQRVDASLYLAVAAEYRRTRGEAAVRAIRSWSRAHIFASIQGLREDTEGQHVIVQRTGVAGRAPKVDFRTVEAAALMHVEAGLLELQSLDGAKAKNQFSAATSLVEWSHELRAQRLRLHQKLVELPEAAREDALQRFPAVELTIDKRGFYVALAAATLAIGFPESALPYAERAKAAAPLDGEALLLAACAKEGLALMAKARTRDGEARRLWKEAEALFREALAADAAQAEARLRLGGVLIAGDRPDEAEEVLRLAAEQARDDRQRYLALLFLGRASERRPQSGDAAAFYRRALEAWPESQAARLALARALDASVGPIAAHPVVMASLLDSKKPERAPDPWWSYPFGPRDLAKAAMERLWQRTLGRSFGP
jgi:tetratricopeptide (TPR) repeat protein